jgi:hypothetical protein
MSVRENENRGHSVFQRLLNLAKAEKTDFNMLLVRYGAERLLYRLSISSYSGRFILKGASLFLVMKDIYDLSLLSKLFVFDGGVLLDAVIKTFNRRKTDFPDGVPIALSEVFAKDRIKKEQWNAFIRRANPEMAQNDLQKAVAEVAVFLLPILESARRKCLFDKTWEPGGAWK